MRPCGRPRLRSLAAYGVATLLCCTILTPVLQLWKANWSVPLDPRGGDVAFTTMQVKTIVDNGWILRNRFVGMPTGLNVHDFPLPDNLHFLIAKLLSCTLIATDIQIREQR